MANRYVDVTITRQTAAVAQAGFGTALILATSKVQAYKEYTTAAAIGVDLGAGSAEAKLAEKLFGGTPKVDKVAVLGIVYNGETDNPTELTAALNALILANNDWYYLLSPEKGDDEIVALSSWADANGKLYFADTINQSLAVTGMNTIIMVHNEAATTYPAAAWVGVGAPLAIGSFTWSFKTLPGINPSTYDETAVNAIHDKSFNTYIRQSGVNITSNGKTAGGEWIDIIQSQHYLEARISEAVFGLMARLPKIPFTDGGIALVVSEIEAVLQQAFNQGIIADEDGKPLYSVSAPSRSDIPTNDRANRRLPDIKFSAILAGAVEDVGVNGVLSI